MNEKSRYGFGIKVNRQLFGAWSFGSCLAHAFGETYLYINFAVWTVRIGWMAKERKDDIID